MESTRLLASVRDYPVRERVRKYFNPEGFDSGEFRSVVTLGLLGLLLGELTVYILLHQSAELGELPHYITDALIIGISVVEFLLGPVIGWLGLAKRRKAMAIWMLLALVCWVPLFALPGPGITRDAGLCAAIMPRSAAGISGKAAVRLSLLLVCGLACALARLALMAHSLAYINEFNPSDNLHMHVGILLLHKIMVLLVGNIMMKQVTVNMTWLQVLAITIKLLITLLRLHRYPVVAPVAEKHLRSEKSLFRSLLRVVSNPVVMLLILAMSMLASALWGFGVHEPAFSKVKYRIAPNYEKTMTVMYTHSLYIPIILAVILAGYMYTRPVMPKYDRKAATRNAVTMSVLAAVMYVLMSALLGCSTGELAGLGQSYIQPTCGQSCGCDRPWMEFTPVCIPEQMTTYFSPCHAGCATADTVNSVSVFSNCTCTADGRAMVGACSDSSCGDAYALHQILFVVVALTSSLALVWQSTVLIESVDRRDISVALGLASGVVSLFTFVGAHGFYLGISYYTCAFQRGTKCLLQSDQFAPWVGYSSATLAGLSMLFSLFAFIVLKFQKEPKTVSTEDLGLG